MRRGLLLLGVLLVAIGAGVAVVALDPFDEEDASGILTLSPDDELATEVASITPLGFEIPELTEDDRAAARAIAQADPTLLAALDGNPFTIEGMGVWHQGPNLLGAGTTLHFDPPITLEYDWPFVTFDDPDNSPVYSRGSLQYRAEDISEMALLIDLGRGEVVSIKPYKTGRIIPREPFPTPAQGR